MNNDNNNNNRELQINGLQGTMPTEFGAMSSLRTMYDFIVQKFYTFY